MYRSYIGQRKYAVVLDEIKDGSPDKLQAVRKLADYLSETSRGPQIVSDLDKLVSTGSIDIENETFLVCIGSIYYNERCYESALKLLHQSDALESLSLMIQILLKIDRVDLARKEWKKMQLIEEDHILTQLSLAWINLAMVSLLNFHITPETCNFLK